MEAGIEGLHASNRAAWNQGAAAYEAAIDEDVEFLRAGGKNLCEPEYEFLHDLESWCGRAIHLQCAGGKDTLSLWNHGAKEVVGIDISDRMIACARAKGDALRAPAIWHRCDVFDAPKELDGTADLVYTGRGALCWIMDLDRWAQVIFRLLKPGGKLYVFEGHPFSELWAMDPPNYELDPEYGDYFNERPLASNDWPSTYIADGADGDATKFERLWRLSEIVNAVTGSGLRLERLGEHPDLFWDRFPNMDPGLVRRLPQTFSLLASKVSAPAVSF